MKLFNSILKGIILLIIVGICIFIQRKYFPAIVETTITDTIYQVHDSVIYVPKPVPYLVQLPPDTVEIPVDTTELVRRYLALHKEFYSIKEYRDTFKVDTLGIFTTYEKVYMNTLDSMSVSYNLVAPKVITNTTIIDVKNSWYVGGMVGKQNVSPMVLYNRKNKYNYFVSYNLVNGGINAGVLINLKEIKWSGR